MDIMEEKTEFRVMVSQLRGTILTFWVPDNMTYSIFGCLRGTLILGN